jgi:TetR/AcrR family transcriptional regulator, cholesterol catabolism regulator
MTRMTRAIEPDGPLDWRDSPAVELSPILSAALDAFHENGFHGTSVRDIAARVGVTVPALYYHHRNKEMILFTLLDSSIDQMHRLCEAAVAEPVDEPPMVFFHLFESITRYMSRSGKISYLDSEMHSLSPELRQVYVDKRDAIEAMVLGEVEAGYAAGWFVHTSPRHTTRALLGMVQAIATWYRPDGDLSVDDVARLYRDIAAHTIGATPEVMALALKETGS